MAGKRDPQQQKQRKPAAERTDTAPTPEERYLRLQESAYYLAESDGFARDPVEYWIEAEAEEAADPG